MRIIDSLACLDTRKGEITNLMNIFICKLLWQYYSYLSVDVTGGPISHPKVHNAQVKKAKYVVLLIE